MLKSLNEIICFGVRDYERPMFETLNSAYSFKLTYCEDFLTSANLELAIGYQAIIVRGNCLLNAKSIEFLAESGLKYLLTRSTGYDHLDITACRNLGIKVANVPAYSPNAISELVISLAMMLVRHTAYIVSKTSKRDFRNDQRMYSKEMRNCVVGVIGCGKIGLTTAKLFCGLGAKVIGYDPLPKPNQVFLEYKTLDELLQQADIITLHLPYIPGENHNFIDENKLHKMKDGVIIINTSRGEILDLASVVKYLETGKIAGFGLDVIPDENKVFYQKFSNTVPNPLIEKLVKLYPRVLITPHIGSCTDEALKNMVQITFQNYREFLDFGSCRNSLTD